MKNELTITSFNCPLRKYDTIIIPSKYLNEVDNKQYIVTKIKGDTFTCRPLINYRFKLIRNLYWFYTDILFIIKTRIGYFITAIRSLFINKKKLSKQFRKMLFDIAFKLDNRLN